MHDNLDFLGMLKKEIDLKYVLMFSPIILLFDQY